MAAVLYFGRDDKLPKILESFFAARKMEAGAIHTVTLATEVKKFEEALFGISFDVIYVEGSTLNLPPIEWIENFTKRFKNIKSPIVLIGDEQNPAEILKFVRAGFTDYIVNPPDRPLVVEQFGILTTGKRATDIRQVYSLQLSQHMDLAKPGILEEISEVDCKVRSELPVPLEELLILYADTLSTNASERYSVLGRCYQCVDHPNFKGQYLASFFFLGASPGVLKNVRNSLRKTYVLNKQK